MNKFSAFLVVLAGSILAFGDAFAQQQQAVTANHVGNKVYLELGLPALQADLETLFSQSAAGSLH